MGKGKIVVAGHICLDITPVFSSDKVQPLSKVLIPGKLVQMKDVNTVVRHELLEYGNRTCVHPHMRIGVCHDGSVEIDRYDCSFNGHIGYFF